MLFRALAATFLLAALAAPAAAQTPLFHPSAAKQADLTPRQAEILGILRAEPATAEVEIVTADAAALASASAVSVRLPDGATVTLATRARTHRQPADFTWSGGEAGAPGPESASGSLVVRGGWLTGTLRTASAVYTVRPLTGGLHAVARQSFAGVPDHPDGYEAFVRENGAAADDRFHRGGGTTADIVLAYTSEVASAYADPVAFAQSVVASANETFVTMGMAVRLSLSFAFQTATATSGSMYTDLDGLRAAGDGAFDDATTYRDAYGADLVSLLGPGSGTYGACGLANLNASATTAVSVTAYDCAVGNYSFAHEIAHNYGARHDIYVDSNTAPYAYAHGYVNTAGRWRTVMAYNTECNDAGTYCQRVGYWSDPDVDYPDTTAPVSVGPTGAAAYADNARLLDERASAVAAFRVGGEPPVLDIGPGSIGVSLTVGETTTASIALSNDAASGALPLSWSASLQNESGPALAPGARGGSAGTALVTATPFGGAWPEVTHASQDGALKTLDCVDGETQGPNSGSSGLAIASGGMEYGQSFTAACTGRVESLAFLIDYSAAPNETWAATLRFYEGEGTGGAEIHGSSFGWTNGASGAMLLTLTLGSPVDVVKGQAYTWFMDLTSGSSATWTDGSDPDAGGTLYLSGDGNPANAAAVTGVDARHILTLLAPTTPSITWVRLASASGSIDAGAGATLGVTLDATGLAAGTYTADLVVTSNDPDAAAVTIPIALVVDPPAGTIALGGTAGWRLLSAPSDATVDDLAALNLVAGVPGYYPTYPAPTLFTRHDGTDWVPSTGAGEVLTPGRGFMWYFYDVADTPVEPTTHSSSSVALPAVLSAPQAVRTADVDVTLHAMGNRFNVLGNPFPDPLAVDDLLTWPGASAIGQKGRVYAYDPETGGWSYPASTIAPWHGFVVRARRSADGQTLSVGKTTAGTILAFELEGTEAETGRVLRDRALALGFEEGAEAGPDDYDADKLAPMADAFVALGVRSGDVLRAYEARSPETASFEVPLVLRSAGAAMEMTLRWDGAMDLPADWRVTLHDRRTGVTVDLREQTAYTFSAPPAPRVSLGGSAAPLQPLAASSSARFTLTVDTGRQPTASEAVTLAPPAPNPVRHEAALTWALAQPESVSLEVVDLLGRVVQTLADGPADAGTHVARVRADALAAGVYLVRLRAGEETRIQRLTIAR